MLKTIKIIISKTNIVWLIIQAMFYISVFCYVSIAVGFAREALMLLITVMFLVGVYKVSQQLAIESKKIMQEDERKEIILDTHKKIIAVHEAGHALISRIKCKHLIIDNIDVKRRNQYNGCVTFKKLNFPFYSKSELYSEICMHLAGMAAEFIVYEESTTGCKIDIKNARDMAYTMVEDFGMGSHFFNMSKEYTIQEAELILSDSWQETARLIDSNLAILLDLQDELMKKTYMNEKEVDEFFKKHGI